MTPATLPFPLAAVPPVADPGGLTIFPAMNATVAAILLYVLAGLLALLLLAIGYAIGKFIGRRSSRKLVSDKENELFTAQRGFKQVYENEMNGLKSENAELKEKLELLGERLEEYRKKAAGYGGLFNSGGKKSDAMYALLLENEALEEALHRQNEKLQQERTDSVKESVRSAGYRRVLMSQLMNDERIKEYVAEILNDDKRLPALPPGKSPSSSSGSDDRPTAVDAGSRRTLPAVEEEGVEVESR